MDIDFDLPEAYLPEFPPPMFLTTRPDLGDVSRGHEVTLSNFRELFEGIITPEQMEGLRLLVTRFPTSWFNFTKHRVTAEPSRGVSCFDCHVNGHANGAIALDPSTRPTLARVRLDTPSIRGNHIYEIFSLRRSIRSLDHFAEVEEYFDGDIALQPQVGGRQLDRPSTNRMTAAEPTRDSEDSAPTYDLELLLPVHNEGASIRRTIEELYEHISRYVRLRFIICEDGSTDSTKEILTELSSRIPMPVVRYIPLHFSLSNHGSLVFSASLHARLLGQGRGGVIFHTQDNGG